jgi:hypothetical protein
MDRNVQRMNDSIIPKVALIYRRTGCRNFESPKLCGLISEVTIDRNAKIYKRKTS